MDVEGSQRIGSASWVVVVERGRRVSGMVGPFGDHESARAWAATAAADAPHATFRIEPVVDPAQLPAPPPPPPHQPPGRHLRLVPAPSA